MVSPTYRRIILQNHFALLNFSQASRRLRHRATQDGRSIIVLALIFYFVALLFVRSQSDSKLAWQRFGVYHLSPAFADMRFILCAIESQRAGYNPYQINPRDPWHRPMNYPRLWLSLGVLGLGEQQTVPLSIALALIFYLSLLLLVGPLTFQEGGFYGFLICSPAVMLGVERGNVDLLIFALLALAIELFQRQESRSIWPYGVIMVCSLLKLYPIFAMAVALRDRSRTVALSIISGAAALFLSYLLWIRSDLITIMRNTWQTANISFGSKVVFLYLNWWTGRPINTTAWSIGCVAVVIAVAMVMVKRTARPLFTTGTVVSMLIGMSIYVGIFVFLTSNFNYKLIFLIFAVPQMLQWIRGQNANRNFAFTFLTVMTLALWMSAQEIYWQFLSKELMNWCLFGMSMVVLLHFLFASLGSKRSLNHQSLVR